MKFPEDDKERIPGIKVSSYLISKLGYETFNSADDERYDAGEDR